MIFMRISSIAFVCEQVLATLFLVDLNRLHSKKKFYKPPSQPKKQKSQTMAKLTGLTATLSFLFYTVLAEDSCLSRFIA